MPREQCNPVMETQRARRSRLTIPLCDEIHTLLACKCDCAELFKRILQPPC